MRLFAPLARIGVLVCLLASVGSGVVSASGSPAGTPVAWGCANAGDFGQCIVPAGLSGVTAVSAGQYHSLARKSDGTVVAWGCGGGFDFGQCAVP